MTVDYSAVTKSQLNDMVHAEVIDNDEDYDEFISDEDKNE